ncbi:MAG TPA: Rieske 2Fe-2S domain-containing protein [Solirubrobacterales bacterium]|nr:Rieske 2Fe-2S domain-containing protein [Solirubrobacterales bacterium]
MIRLCGADEVPAGEGRVVRVNGRPLALFRAGGGWFATQATCPHLGGPLADGIAAESSVICPIHERRFDLRSGEPLGHECAALVTYEVLEQGGEVFLLGRVPDNEAQPEVSRDGVQEPA